MFCYLGQLLGKFGHYLGEDWSTDLLELTSNLVLVSHGGQSPLTGVTATLVLDLVTAGQVCKTDLC